jgi:hypothetical protein
MNDDLMSIVMSEVLRLELQQAEAELSATYVDAGRVSVARHEKFIEAIRNAYRISRAAVASLSS